MEDRIAFSAHGTGTPEYIHMNECSCSLIPYSKINSKIIIDLHVRNISIKLLEENLGVNFHELELGRGFLNMAAKKALPKDRSDKVSSP